MESRVNEFKNTREKLNMQHLGTMTTVEKEMEQMCLKSARSHKSNSNLKSHRSLSASKKPVASHEVSRRSSRANDFDFDGDYRLKASSPQHNPYANADQLHPTSGAKRITKPKTSGIRSPHESKAHSLVPPLPIHMIANKNEAATREGKHRKGQN